MFANDPATISRLEDTLSLAQSLAEVSARKKTKEDESKSEKAKAALSLAPQADTDLAKACTAVHHDFEADPRVPEGCAMTLTVKKLESLATMLGFAIKGDAKRKKALHFTLQASARIPPLRANCARGVPHHGGGRQRQRARAARQPAPCLAELRPRPRALGSHTCAPSNNLVMIRNSWFFYHHGHIWFCFRHPKKLQKQA